MAKRRRSSWSQQIVTIENKGRVAYRTGVLQTANPYSHGRVGLQKQRRRAWDRGWQLAAKETRDAQA